MPTTNYWGLQDIADYLDVEYSSARTYHGRAEINRRRGTVRPGDMPPPDWKVGNSPVWLIEKIVLWNNNSRPGKGAGGGRPRGTVVVVRQECPLCHQKVGVTQDRLFYNHRIVGTTEYCENSRALAPLPDEDGTGPE